MERYVLSLERGNDERSSTLTLAERGALEGIITFRLQGLKRVEDELCSRYRLLNIASANERAEFLASLWELDKAAASLETLICRLDTN